MSCCSHYGGVRNTIPSLVWVRAYLLVVAIFHIDRVSSTIDVVAQLHQLQLNKVMADQISLPQDTPSTLARRLSERGKQWKDLSGHLQRALLWDIGLVLALAPDGTLALIQVYVPCGKTMSQIFLSKAGFGSSVRCPIEACNEKTIRFASADCSIGFVQGVAQCAVDSSDKVNTSLSNSTLWSDDGEIESIPNIRVYRYEDSTLHTANDTTTSAADMDKDAFLFTINQEQTVLRTRQNCPARSFFTEPCTVRSPANAGDWCPPIRGRTLDLWFDNEEKAQPSLSTTIFSLLLFVATALLGIIAVGLFIVRNQRRRRRTALSTVLLTDMPTLSCKSNDFHLIPVLPLSDSFCAEYTMHPSDSDVPTDEVLGNGMESFCQESDEKGLAILCNDRELMNKRIPYSCLRFVKMIGRGANGEVWKAQYNSQTVAIKSLLPDKRHDKSCIEVFAREIRLASALEHPNIVRFIGLSWRQLSDICSVSEFMSRGDLSDLLQSKQSGKLSWKSDKMCIATDIASALVYLHSLVPLIIHRDLKSHNVLLNDELHAKLSDFGLSRERSFEDTMTNGIGTLLWTAPEILRGEAYTEKADIFSYGIVLAELDTCLPPYSLNDEVAKLQLTSMQLMHLVTQGELLPRFRSDCPSALEELALRCVSTSPADRPSAAHIVFTLRSQVLPSLLAIE